MYKSVLKPSLNNILIVENNSFIGKKIVSAIENINSFKNVYSTNSIQEATFFINKYSFQLIILDLKLKDGNGLEILKMLKEKQINVKIFVFSINKELNKICLKQGATGFYDKAKDFDILIEDIKKLN